MEVRVLLMKAILHVSKLLENARFLHSQKVKSELILYFSQILEMDKEHSLRNFTTVSIIFEIICTNCVSPELTRLYGFSVVNQSDTEYFRERRSTRTRFDHRKNLSAADGGIYRSFRRLLQSPFSIMFFVYLEKSLFSTKPL